MKILKLRNKYTDFIFKKSSKTQYDILDGSKNFMIKKRIAIRKIASILTAAAIIFKTAFLPVLSYAAADFKTDTSVNLKPFSIIHGVYAGTFRNNLSVYNTYADINLMTDEAGTIHIKNEDEFLLFASLCSSDEFSEGRQFALEADLDFTQISFKSVPVFAGNFEGNSHTIKGIFMQISGESNGVFRYNEVSGIIKNLNIGGDLSLDSAPDTKKSGGICGINKGRIENCTFSGSISSLEDVGGICGINETGAVIEACINYSAVNGNKRIGGICGYNNGNIISSLNKGNINTSDRDMAEDDKNFNPENIKEAADIEKIQDGGGIAGYSGGNIISCINEGNVGYRHKGYNVGGIAGRHSGIITECINRGTITGRKDTGGITGQFEPYLNIVYNRDTFDNVEDELDEISRLERSLSENIESTADNSAQHMDNARDIINNIKKSGRSNKTELKNDRDSFRQDLNQKLDLVDSLADTIDSDIENSPMRDSFYPIRDDINDLKSNIDKLKSGEWDNGNNNIISRIINLKKLIENINQTADNLSDDTNRLLNEGVDNTLNNVDTLKENIRKLYEEFKGISDLSSAYINKLNDTLDNADKDISADVDRLSSELDSLSKDVKSKKENIRSDKRNIENSIDNIQDSIKNEKENTRSEPDSKKDNNLLLFSDASDDLSSYEGNGMIKGCENTGNIISDYQGGGIAGNIGIDIAADPEYDIDTQGSKSFNITRNAYAVLSLCKNLGNIKVKNDYAGGIAGKAGIGLIKDSQNYGDVASADGSYAGGIAGSSQGSISASWSMGEVDAKSYIGGIAGLGNTLKDNYAMAFIKNTDSEFTGSIAGYIKEDADMSGNIYVNSGIGAVDRITRKKQARGIDYYSFISGENVPENFKHLKVVFETDDIMLKTLELDYGNSVDISAYPEVPEKDGYYYMWEYADLSNITQNKRVKAYYLPWKTAIASSDDERPLLLAEGNFLPEARLVINNGINNDSISEKNKTKIATPEGFKLKAVYSLNIENAPTNANYIYHLYVKGADAGYRIGVINTDSKKYTVSLLESSTDGNYILFNAGADAQIAVLKKDYVKPAALIFALVLIAAGTAAYIIIKKKA